MMKSLLGTAAAVALAGSAMAQALQPPGGGGGGPSRYNPNARVEVGGPAPPLEILEWVKGEGVERLEEGKTYVVDFWATWCGPCIRSIPHLTELAEKYPDMTFIGISDEDVETVRPFVDKMGTRMDYHVAVDNRKRNYRQWMDRAGRDTIPSVFVIDDRLKIAWIGNPLDEEFPRIVGMVASGRYDPVLTEAAQPLLDQVNNCVKVKEWRTCMQYLDEVIKMDAHVFHTVAIEKFRILLMEKGDVDEALAYANGEFRDTYSSDAETLRMLARDILRNKTWVDRAPDQLKALAMDLATEAHRIDSGADSLATLALAYFHTGKVDEAISHQRKAYLIAEPEDKAYMKRQLEEYQRGAAMMRNG